MPRILTQTDVADFRERLCEVAAGIFVELGHNGFNMRELAKRLGVSAMTPYRYFKNKDEIFAAVRDRAFSRFADRLEAAQAGAASPEEKGAAVAHAYVQLALQDPAHYRLMFDLAQAQGEPVPELVLHEGRVRASLTNHVRQLLEEGIFEGEPELIGQVLWSSLHGVVVLHLAGKLRGAEFERVLAETLRVIANIYRRAPIPALYDAASARPMLAAVGH